MHLLVTEPEALGEARAILDAELDAVESAASRFRADSEVCALAAAGGARRRVSPTLATLLESALAAARITDGDVDPTVGAAVRSLGYDVHFGNGDPGDVRVTPAAADWTAVWFDGQSVQVPPGTLLDLGATAKAVAADRGAWRIHDLTGVGVLVNLGGDIATAGPPPRDGWRVDVGDPGGGPVSRVTIGTGTGLATSSTRRRRWRHGGVLHHHIVDPHTGTSADPVWRTVSVAADSCLAANTVSTAAIVRGERAPAWIASLGLAARLVDAAGVETALGGWPS